MQEVPTGDVGENGAEDRGDGRASGCDGHAQLAHLVCDGSMIVGKPYEGEPHVRFDEGSLETGQFHQAKPPPRLRPTLLTEDSRKLAKTWQFLGPLASIRPKCLALSKGPV